MHEKTWFSYCFFGKWCAVRRGPRVIPQKVTSHVTKNLNNTGERGVSVYIGKKPVGVLKKKHFGGGYFDSGFLQCLGVVA